MISLEIVHFYDYSSGGDTLENEQEVNMVKKKVNNYLKLLVYKKVCSTMGT